MGNMADYFMNQVIDYKIYCEEEYYDNFVTDYSSPINDIDDDCLEVIRQTSNPNKICRCCNTDRLHWKKIKGKYRLFDSDNNIHVCPINPIKDNND